MPVTPPAGSSPGDANPATSPPRVLVVDDEPLIGTAIRRVLTKHGLDVTFEDSAQAAHERLKRGERFDVIICDLMMPLFSGVELYAALDVVAPELRTRVIFMTGNAFTPEAHELFETTKNVRLDKPFVPADVIRAVSEVMRRHGSPIDLP